MQEKLEAAYMLAIGPKPLPQKWVARMDQLAESPSVAFIAGVGAVLLAKATDPKIDAFVLKSSEGKAGAFSLRSAATALAARKRAFGYDIGSTSDRDPINHGTLNGFPRWDSALVRITKAHKPFYQLILQWLADVNKMSQDEALEALAAFIRARRSVSASSAVEQVPLKLADAPSLTDLIDVLEGFVSANAEGGACGMALVAAVYRSAGYEAGMPSRNDPRHIDVPIGQGGQMLIGSEVKQVPTKEDTADTLATDVVEAGARLGLLAVLRPGYLDNFDRTGVILRAGRDHGVVIRITDGVQELLHEAIAASTVPIDDLCGALPRHFAEALEEIRVEKDTIIWRAGRRVTS
jgi:hypothetical protein